jgi:DNA-binding CsgD family transcriptional regulator
MPLGKPLLDALDRMGFGGVLLDSKGEALLVNRAAQRILVQPTNSECSGQRGLGWVRDAIKALLNAGTTRFRTGDDAWIMVPREGQRPLALHAVPVAGTDASGAHTVLILVDLHRTPTPDPAVLQQMFALTPTEAKIAVRIARGDSPADIANEHGVSISTIRFHLSSVLAKTQTRRQAELVALLACVSILP